jgi:translation initiation factor IF-2
MRVHELAKEFGMSSSKLIEEIKGYGIVVKSHLSGLDDDRVADIRYKHTVAQVAIRLENELQERKKEEIVVEEDWEFIDSEEVDKLLVPEVEETEDENKSGGISDEMEDGELKPTSHENRERLEPVQEIIVEKPKGFWSWLKSLFT